ncbi:condensation domain-containing protein [Streptomyces sp. GSL17-111]|uniref:condensation domain-containing protein n=1 Tax=Streptomyces sp. GSL17-111 TaxID=3121596 RepID=UPI0030F414D5
MRAAEDAPADAIGTPARSTRAVTVAYAGGAERRGPLTLGQANMIRCMLRDDPAYINIHAVWPVPEGVGTQAVIDAFRALVERHEALRTTFPHGPDAAPREQVVAAAGRFTVTVVDQAEPPPDAERYSEAERYAEAVADRDRVRRFGLAEEFPLRISVLTRRGTPAFVALAASHAATDAGALAVLHDEWRTLLAGTELPPLTAVTPLELAAEEASPAGVRKSEASLRYWERILRTGPQAMFAEPHAVPPEGRQPQLTLRSRRGARALARAATRTGNAPSTVLLTAWCALLAHRAGQPACVIALPTSNRFTRRLTRAVTTVSQDALLHLDVRVPSFDALLRTAFGGVLDAYRHSRFDALRLWEMVERVTDERGSHFARDVVFNDVSALAPAAQDADPPEPGPGPELELCRGPGQALPTRALAFAHATTPLLHLSLWADPALFPRAEAEGFLTGLVRLLEAVAEEDVPLSALGAVTGVRPAERGPEWRRVDGCWVSPPAVADALGRALDGRPVHVTVDEAPDGGAGPRLTAYVAAGGDPLTPERAHAALRDVLPGRPGLLAPHRYVIVQDPPPDGGPGSTWTAQRVLAEGDGRKRQVRQVGQARQETAGAA